MSLWTHGSPSYRILILTYFGRFVSRGRLRQSESVISHTKELISGSVAHKDAAGPSSLQTRSLSSIITAESFTPTHMSRSVWIKWWDRWEANTVRALTLSASEVQLGLQDELLTKLSQMWPGKIIILKHNNYNNFRFWSIISSDSLLSLQQKQLIKTKSNLIKWFIDS